MTAQRIGFIGLGVMGRPMALNLLKAGFDVTVHSRREATAEAAVASGANWAPSVAECVADTDAIVTMLPDGPDVEAVVAGPDGVLAHAPAECLLIDMSTISPPVARRLERSASASGRSMLDAPVSGGEVGAVQGVLSIMAGGTAESFARAMPIFQALGRTIVHVGPAGAGQTVKAANQLLVGGIIELLAESMLLIERSMVDVEAALSVLAGGLAANRVLELKGESMAHRSFEPGFRIDLHTKDMGIVADAARESGLALPLAAIVHQLFTAARAQGFGGLDHSGLLAALDGLNSPRPPSA